ncbi:MAG TPA: two-component regulator propeller domain-containing protein [Bacteroidia bacterium]|nr:two-component regulator propeller domain-containing protein [Bacteroidia bacterium]
MITRFKFFFFLLLLASCVLCAQSNLYFRHFTIQQGLSQNTVTSILQDNSGFLWLGTEDGLNRYNGYDVDVFKHDPSDARTISHSNIRCIFEDVDEVLWIGTDDGLNSFERSSEKFIHYRTDSKNSNSISSNVISGIAQDINGILWIGTNNGLNSFDAKTNTWAVYKHDGNKPSLSNDNISCITFDKEGMLWIGTNGSGLNRFDVKNKKFSDYKNDPSNDRSISENTITAIYPDKSGYVWVGTVNEGLNKFDKASGGFIHYRNNPPEADENSISQNSVFSLCEDAQGTLWVGTLGGGLNAFNKASGKFVAYKNNSLNPSSLSNNSIWSLCEDHAGALWIGTREGVNILDKRMKRFETVLPNPASANNSVYSICEDKQGTLWFGILGEGLVAVEKNGTKKNYQNDPANTNSIISNNVFSLCEDKEGLLWVGTYDGLNSFDKSAGKFTRYANNPGNKFSLSDNYVRTLLTDNSGTLWIGTYGGGLNSFEKSTGNFTCYKNDAGGQGSLNSNLITCLFQDESGTLFIGTYGDGLFSYDKPSKTFTVFKNEPANETSLSNNFIHCITRDRSGTIWIGTYGGGLNAFDKNKKTFSRYTERNGLSNNVINGIVPDINGNLWLSTNKGISKFITGSKSQEEKNNVRTYDSQDGAQNKYNEGSFFKSKNGKIFFGGAMGYNAFFPDDIRDNPYQPPVVITRFYLFEKPHSMDTMITSKRTVVLSYRQNFFSFEFAGLNYTYPEKNQYAYRMEGLDKTWNYCNNRRYAAYTNIDPGEYTFRVIASNNDGVWNEQGTFLRITITPPFWKTWWFSIVAGILVAASIVLYIRFRTRTLTTQNVVLEQKVEQRTSELKEKNDELVKTMDNLKSTQDQLIHSEKMASLGQLTAGIAHEIQNPLNFVNNFSRVSVELLDDLKQVQAGDKTGIIEDLKTNLEKITHHGERAERIVKGMLMHSRTGSSEKLPADLNKLIEDSFNLAYTGIRTGDNSFKCEVKTNYDLRITSVNIVPQDISRVMLNLINNAFYAMNEKRKKAAADYQPVLSLSTSLHEQMVSIKISDNGYGIPRENRDKIFQPFFTTKPTGVGTGLGLSLSYDIITKRHGGEIKMESRVGEGTDFIIILPV